MIPRGKLYIRYSDILAGFYYSLFHRFHTAKPGNNKTGDNQLICLSVRTGFDLVLTALNFPAGTAILVTDINIPGMFDIITAHQLTAVPLAVNKHSLNIAPADIAAAITPNTKALLITHLFGGIMDTDELLQVAKANNLIVLEDCAQAFVGDAYTGNKLSDIILFSFGFIKTNTAATGAMLQINNKQLYQQIVLLNDQLPQQSVSTYLKKCRKILLVKLLNEKPVYTCFYKWITLRNKSFDTVLSAFTKGFPANDILLYIRYKPCEPNIRLIKRRLENFDSACIDERKALAMDILDNIPERYKIGSQNAKHSYWILPVETEKPDELIHYLRTNGFDASQKASSLVRHPSSTNLTSAILQLEKLVYLPMYPLMRKKDRTKLAGLLTYY